MSSDLDSLERRLGEKSKEESFGSVHVQTDDQNTVERRSRASCRVSCARRRASSRLPGTDGSASTTRSRRESPNGCGGSLRSSRTSPAESCSRSARSEDAVVRTIAFERGQIMDEYLSVPEVLRRASAGGRHGAARRTPTLLARLTGAPTGGDPEGGPDGRIDRPSSASGRAARRAGRASSGIERRRSRRRRGRASSRARSTVDARMNVVLLHAFPLDERMWEPQLPALAGHEVVAPNLYDLGGSSIDGWARAHPGRAWTAISSPSVRRWAATWPSRWPAWRLNGSRAAARRRAPERGLAGAAGRSRGHDRAHRERRCRRALGEPARQALRGTGSGRGRRARAGDGALSGSGRARARSGGDAGPGRTAADVLRSHAGRLRARRGRSLSSRSTRLARSRAGVARARLVVFERSRHLPNLEQPAEFNETAARAPAVGAADGQRLASRAAPAASPRWSAPARPRGRRRGCGCCC